MGQMEQLSARLANRPAQLKKMKQAGAKIVALFPGEYVPEELIYASGAIPLCLIHGAHPKAVNAARHLTTRYFCPFARAQFGERLLNEQPYYNLVDILIAPTTCQHLRRVADLWEYYTEAEVFRLGIPHEYHTSSGSKYYGDMLWSLKERLEQLTGSKITEEKLQTGIALYNRMRELLKEISLMRRAAAPPLTSWDFLRLNHASFYLDPEFMVDFLTSLRDHLEQKREAPAEEMPRLILTGPNLACGDYKVLELIEEVRGMVVAEEFCEGVRYYWQNVAANGDAMQSLAVRYLDDRLPCAFIRPAAKRRSDFLIQLAREFDAAGIIWYQLKYCETYDMEAYLFAQKAKEIGMPMLKLESEYDIADRAPLKTRLETFIHILKGE